MINNEGVVSKNVTLKKSSRFFNFVTVISTRLKFQTVYFSFPWNLILGTEPPRGGGYCHTLPIRVCAAQRGRDLKLLI